MSTPFFIKDCALATIGTGETASSLTELRDILFRIPESSIYHHFWGGRLQPSYAQMEYHNDFARWVHTCLHDDILFERLVIIDPTECTDLEELRRVIIDIIENRLDEIEYILWSKGGSKFHFLLSNIIIFNTGISINMPIELVETVHKLTPSSIFYHFIDARRRTPNGIDDFSFWLSGFKEEYASLIDKIRHIDPYFLSLSEIKQRLSEVIAEHFR